MGKVPTRRVSSPFLVGLFVISGVMLALAVVIWLSASQLLKENTYYVTYFEGSVEGLDPGSPVKYLGVPVGSVSKISVAEDGRIIEVTMSIDKKIKIVDSMRVKAEMAGIAGGKFMQIYFPTDEKIAEMYPRITFHSPYPVIRSSPSGIQEIEIAAREVMNNMMQLKVGEISEGTVGFLNASTKFFNNDELYEIVSRINEAGTTLNHILSKADTSDIINNLGRMSTELLKTSEELKHFAVGLNSQVEKIELSTKVEHAFAAYDTAMVNITRMVDLLGYRGETALFGVTEAIEEMKATNRQLKKSLRAVSESPTQVFFHEPPKKEK